jgi:hypothetical protein
MVVLVRTISKEIVQGKASLVTVAVELELNNLRPPPDKVEEEKSI